ncbi:MAG TPA: FAD-dependent oxidoreductase, partial [Niabella sp.]
MNVIEEEKRELPVYARPEVLVVGAGPAGIGAAIAAARNGSKVLLLERYGFLGGNLTIAMVNPMFTFHDVKGKQVIRGIAGELVNRLVTLKSSQGHITDLTFDNASMTPFDPEGMKYL